MQLPLFIAEGDRLGVVIEPRSSHRSSPRWLESGWNWMLDVPDEARIGFFLADDIEQISWHHSSELSAKDGWGMRLEWDNGSVTPVALEIDANAEVNQFLWRPDQWDWEALAG